MNEYKIKVLRNKECDYLYFSVINPPDNIVPIIRRATACVLEKDKNTWNFPTTLINLQLMKDNNLL